MTYFGFSGYGVSVADLQNLIPVMQAYHMNIIRISGTPPWLPVGLHSLKYDYVDYILANTDFNVIIDPNHLFGSVPGYTSADFKTNLAVARAKLLEIANRYKNNPRVFIEIVNEFYDPTDTYPSDTKTYALIQGLINDVRAACSNPIVWDKQPPPVPYHLLTGGNVFQGDHAYFGPNQYNAATIFNNMKAAAASMGLSFISTEVGADWNEGPAFTATSVQTLNGFLSDCNANNFGVCIWLRELTGPLTNPDLIAYKNLGLVIPSNIVPPPPLLVTLTIVPTANGTTNPPPGVYSENQGVQVPVQALPNAGFRVQDWLLDGASTGNSTLSITVTMNAAHTLQVVYQAIPPPPPDQGTISVHALFNKAEIIIPYEIRHKLTGILVSSGNTPALDIVVDVGTYTVKATLDTTVKSADVTVDKNTANVVTFDFSPVPTVSRAAIAGVGVTLITILGIGYVVAKA